MNIGLDWPVRDICKKLSTLVNKYHIKIPLIYSYKIILLTLKNAMGLYFEMREVGRKHGENTDVDFFYFLK